MELGKKIKELRFKAGLTQEQLASQLGMGPQSVSKWENSVTMPDITTLPLLAEIFGVSIDDLFDLNIQQKFNRIENRINIEAELDSDIFIEYEEFLKGQLTVEENKNRAIELIAYLYWHRMEMYANKATHYAKKAIALSPNKKGCQWMLQKADGHAIWDWNVANHTKAIDYYRNLIEENPTSKLSYRYLLDNLIADHRVDEAQIALDKLSKLDDCDPIMIDVYRAHIALANFDEKNADRIIEELLLRHGDKSTCQFEVAQYYAKKCDYEKAIIHYNLSFDKEQRRPRYQDELESIAYIYEIMGDYQKSAETYDRIIDLLQNEWGITEGTALQDAKNKKLICLSKISSKN